MIRAHELKPNPKCFICHGYGRYITGYSGREDDGNAPHWDDCECRFDSLCQICGEPVPCRCDEMQGLG